VNVRLLLVYASATAALSLISGCASAYEPVPYGDDRYIMDQHPAIAAADADAAMAIDRMRAAQRANAYHLGGHAGRAIELMQEARAELAAAAATATP
jgi:hypothetical protein